MSFARALLPTLPMNDVIILVPAAISGTGFVDNTWPAFVGRGFKAAVDRLRQAFQLLNSEYTQFEPRFEGVLWHQGQPLSSFSPFLSFLSLLLLLLISF